MKLICLTALLFLSATSYAKPKTSDKPSVKVQMVHVVNDMPLKMNVDGYVNANGDTFTISMYKYYLTDFSFTDVSGKEFKEAESFHLVNEAKRTSKELAINGIPEGEYDQMSFTIGVDSIYNVSGAQGGALDPINAMFWDWNTGYIMAKVEGSSNKAPEGSIVFHIGGFAGKNSVVRRVTIKFPKKVKVAGGKMPVVYIKSDIAEWFKTPVTIDFAKLPGMMTEGKEAVMIADNYADMFKLDHIE